MSQYLPKTCSDFELDLSNYETIVDVKKTRGVDISFAKKVDLVILKPLPVKSFFCLFKQFKI